MGQLEFHTTKAFSNCLDFRSTQHHLEAREAAHVLGAREEAQLLHPAPRSEKTEHVWNSIPVNLLF